jgi:hypothetical protein
VVLGHGLGELSGKAFRVAHMGHVNAPMMLGILGVIEMALDAISIPHGSGGVKEALAWLGQQVGMVVRRRHRQTINEAYRGRPSLDRYPLRSDLPVSCWVEAQSALTCACHATGNAFISTGSVMSTNCRPSRIASTISGAISVNRNTRVK